MTNLLSSIRESIHELLAKGCKKNDLIISFSPLIESFIIKELYSNGHLYSNTTPGKVIINIEKATKFEGVEINRNWPYNEIIIYDKERAYKNEYLISKIQIVVGIIKNKQ